MATVDIEKQIAYWKDGSVEACRSVPVLCERRFWPEALFWTQLSIEKALKAHVARFTGTVPPLVHNLNRLAVLADIDLDERQSSLCDSLSKWQMLSRYGVTRNRSISDGAARDLIERAEEFRTWLIEKL